MIEPEAMAVISYLIIHGSVNRLSRYALDAPSGLLLGCETRDMYAFFTVKCKKSFAGCQLLRGDMLLMFHMS